MTVRESGVAVIGLAGRFPKAPGVEAFWRSLCAGEEGITRFTLDELREAGHEPEELAHPDFVPASGALEGIELFDAALFGFTPREAEITDPQQRLFLECAWEALEDAGLDPERFPGPVGVYAGTGMGIYLLDVLARPELLESVGQARIVHGNDRDFLATWASYKLNLTGPSLTLQTACSTSLVSVHLAAQALLAGECDAALAGGVSVRPRQKSGYVYREGDILSPDGRCRSFDHRGRGTVGGNGVGVVVLKRLADALADGDPVRAVIAGSAINNDGARKVGYTAPSVEGQARVVSEALAVAGLEPAEIGYVEAHGTATELGDPVEVAALNEVFGPEGSCALGSVKSNIGHLDAAAGVAGLIKTVLAVERGKIPPSLHFEAPNPQIPFAGGPFHVVTELTDWPGDGAPRRAGVSSFGIGGTNAHVVLEEAPAAEAGGPSRPRQLLVLSAQTAGALDERARQLADHLGEHPEVPLADVAHTLRVGRRALPHRRAVVGADAAEAVAQLTAGKPLAGVAPASPPGVVFLFPGQGAQRPGMGAELYGSERYGGEAVYRDAFDRCAEILAPHLGVDLRELLYGTASGEAAAAERLRRTELAQPALFAVEWALAELWESWGVAPQAMLGHSLGEYVAACRAGVFSLEDALALVALRGKLMQELPAGAMLAVPLPEDEVYGLLDDELSLAAVNGPDACTVSGTPAAVDRLAARLAERGLEARRLETSHAFHSRMMDPILGRFAEAVAGVELQPPAGRFVSNLSGTWAEADEVAEPYYWVRHLRQAVRFGDGLATVLASGPAVLLEVGPGRGLTALARRQRTADGERPVAAPSLARPGDSDLAAVLAAAGRLWVHGAALDWDAFSGDERRRRVPLPTYPFERRRYWVGDRPRRAGAAARPASATARRPVEEWLSVPAWRRAPAPAPAAEPDAAWLLVGGGEAGDALAARLEADGARVERVVEDGAGNGAPERVRALAAAGALPERVVHLGALGEAAAGDGTGPLGSLVALARALEEVAPGRPAWLDVAVRGAFRVTGAEAVDPLQATLLGPCRVIPQELPHLRCRLVDLDPAARPRTAAAALAAELAARGGEPVAAWRAGLRWVEEVAPLPWPRQAGERPPRRSDGVYLVTGGRGGVGAALAASLAGEGVRLVLLGRTPLPDRAGWDAQLAAGGAAARQVERVRRLEALGAEVLTLEADVADGDAMARVFAQVEERFGALHGVVHAAGLSGAAARRPVMELDAAELAAQLRAKVGGARVLAELAAGRGLDFVLLVSSLASSLGGPGFAAYAAANAYLDGLAESLAGAAEEEDGTRWITVGWDGWRDDPDDERDPAIAPAEGARVMAAALQPRTLQAEAPPRLLVATRDLAARREQWVLRPATVAAAAPEAPAHPRPELAADYRAPEGDLERRVAGLWQDLLGVERVGVEDDFFELGGNSLSATQLFARLRKELGVSVPMRTLFDAPSVGALAARLAAASGSAAEREGAAATAAEAEPPPLVPVPRDEPLPLSFPQQRLFFLDQFEEGSLAYVIQWPFRLTGALVPAALGDTVSEIVRRHEVLRTRFASGRGEPVQVVEPAAPVPLPRVDLSGLAPADRESWLARLAREDGARGFDLLAAAPLRARLVRLAPREHAVFLTMHHIVTDLLSLRVFVRELTTHYQAFAAGVPSPLPPLPVQYADFAHWQRRWLQGEVLEAQLGFWRQRLAGAPEVLELPTDRPRPLVRGFRGATRRFELPAALAKDLEALARREEATLYMVLLAGFLTVLHRWSGQHDVVVGTPVANRGHVEVEDLVGFFVNTLVLRTDLGGGPGFREALARVRETALTAFAHQDLPFERLVDELGLERDLAHSSVFQVVFQLHHAVADRVRVPGLALAPLDAATETSQFDLTATVIEGGEGIAGSLQYNRELFDATTVERMARHFEAVLAAGVASPETPLARLPMLAAGERHQVAVEWPAEPAPDLAATRLHVLVAERAARAPEAVALVCGEVHLTYGETMRRAHRLARRLRQAGAGPGRFVGVAMERRPELVVAQLAAMAAGAPFLPLDPSLPAERLAFLLADSGVAAVAVAGAASLGGVELPPGVELVDLLDAGERAALAALSDAPLADATGPADLAYAVYTSGSTGRPKGVAVSHDAIAALLLWMQRLAPLGAADRALLKTPHSFDVAVRETFWPLAAGAALVLAPPDGHRDSAYLVDAVRRERVTTLSFVPSMLGPFLAEPGVEECTTLRSAVCGGEVLAPELVARFRTRLAGATLYNHYGPTEATVDATSRRCRGEDAAPGAVVPVGRPLGGDSAWVAGTALAPAPVGVAGELLLGGRGLARGYLGRPRLTAERFVPDPFSGRPGARLYRTGDRARWRADGELHFLGRLDSQVKLRGFRIELGEIEAVLAEHPAVREAAVAVRTEGPGGGQLTAYVVAAGGDGAADAAVLRGHLAERLPEYMVPAVFVPLAELPRTPSGKVDRKALPAAAPAAPRPAAEPPASDLERRLAAIWAEVLGVEAVGVRDDFFELGGDSILSLQIAARAREAGLPLVTRQVFEHRTIAELAPRLEEAMAAGAPAAVPTRAAAAATDTPPPLTPIQHGFFAQDLDDPHHYNQAVLVEVVERLEPAALAAALAAAVRVHEGLRSRFVERGPTRVQEIDPAPERFPLAVVDLAAVPPAARRATLEAAAASLQPSLDLARGPLLRAALFELGPGEPQRLLLVAHHLVVDGVSWRVLLEDLLVGYRQAAAGRAPEPAPEETTFRQWARLLADFPRWGDPEAELAYWTAPERRAAASLPPDYPGGEDTVAAARSLSRLLDEETTRALLQEVPRAYRTQVNDVLLAALARAFEARTGAPRLLVDVEGHGREEVEGARLERTVGWFTTVFPVLLDLPDGGGVGAALKAVKEQLRAVPRRGLGHGLLAAGHAGPEAARRMAEVPAADVLFNYLGRLDRGLPEGAPFRVPRESAGSARSPRQRRSHPLELNAGVVGERLRLDWTWAGERYERATLEALADAYQAALAAIVEHCRAPDAFGYTPSDFPLARLDAAAVDRVTAGEPDVEDLYPLSPLQHGLLFHSLSPQTASLYQPQLSAVLRGPLDRAAFARAWSEAAERHAALRTGFAWQGLERPLQKVRRDARPEVTVEDLRGLDPAAAERRVEAVRAADRGEPFALDRPPLMRLRLLQTADDAHVFVWTHHHLILDGWSAARLVREVLHLYEAAAAGAEVRLERPRPYRDYVEWLERQDLAAAEAHWRRALAGFTAPTPVGLRGEAALPAGGDADYAEVRHALGEEATAAAAAWAQRQGVTLATWVQGAWALLLSRYSGEREVVFGAVTAGRPAELAGAERIVGLFINTLPVRVAVEEGASAGEWLSALQADQAESRQYEFAPLSQIQRWSGVPAGVPLFDSLVVFENYPVEASARQGGGAGSGIRVETPSFLERTSYALTLIAAPGRELSLQVIYDRRRFSDEEAARLPLHLEALLAGLAAAPAEPLARLSPLTAAERERLLAGWADGGPPAGSPTALGLRLDELFAAQAERTPQAPALLAAGGETLSYAELRARAAAAARRLRAAGVGPEVPVGLLGRRRPELVAALLGVLEAGGAYLPLDPAYPAERLRFLLEDSGAAVVVVDDAVAERLPELPAGTVRLSLDEVAAPGEETAGGREAPAAAPGNLAYVLYTSGSTGRPKGVAVAHRSAAALVGWALERFERAELARVAAVTSFNFDLSVFELFAPLACGGAVVLADDALALPRHPAAGEVTLLNTVPSAAAELLAAGSLPAAARTVNLAGEALGRELARRLHAAGVERLYNLYGPSEDTTYSTWELVPPDAAEPPAIGRPLPGTRALVLDRALRPVPAGVAGELHLAGHGLARGYLGRPALTAERFVPDPHGEVPGERLYRTGDRVRWLPDGRLDFLGRLDHQVKLRGFRIELGEVETVLAANPAVAEAAVAVRGTRDDERRLVGYVVAAAGAAASGDGAGAEALRDHLAERLPPYMVPSLFLTLDALPRTPNGKLDRAALPAPGALRPDLRTPYVAPRNDAERLLAGVWQAVLGVDRVGVDDSFFVLGGDSILSLQVVSRAREAGLAITPAQVFEQRTVARLAAVAAPAGASDAEQGEITGPVPLTPIQHWFFDLDLPRPWHWNQALLLEVREPLAPGPLAAAVGELVRHHDALRLRFERDAAGGWRQHGVPWRGETPFALLDLAGLPAERATDAIESAAAAVQGSLSLVAGPLLRCVLFDLGAERPARLLLVAHHLVVDGVSWRVLLEDLELAYRLRRDGDAGLLPPKTTSLRRWAELLAERAGSPQVEAELPLWQSEARRRVRPLPVDRPAGGDPAVAEDRGATGAAVRRGLSEEETENLLRRVPEVYRTEIQEVLLTAVAQVLAEWTGGDAVLVDVEGHGREELADGIDLSRTVGWFTAIHPLLLEVTPETAPGEALKAVKEQVRRVPRHGLGHGLLRYLSPHSDVREALAAMPRAEVVFNFLGQVDQGLREGSPFRAAAESAGPTAAPGSSSPHRLSVEGMILQGRLWLRLGYGPGRHREDTVERLADRLVERLRALVEHCLAAEPGEYTPSDFPQARLGEDELDEVLSELGLDG